MRQFLEIEEIKYFSKCFNYQILYNKLKHKMLLAMKIIKNFTNGEQNFQS